MEHTETKRYNDHNIACAITSTSKKEVVVFCHGYRGDSIGPHRLFVKLSRLLDKEGIGSLRFDQYGSGNSEGDFLDSSFNDWIETAESICKDYINLGYKVSIFGQSMGGATAIAVASRLPELAGVLCWAPDPNVEKFNAPESGVLEEGGQRVKSTYWQEAHDTDIISRLKDVGQNMLIIQCEDDEYVSDENHEALINNSLSHHQLKMLKGYKHSAWSYDEGEIVLDMSLTFIKESFK